MERYEFRIQLCAERLNDHAKRLPCSPCHSQKLRVPPCGHEFPTDYMNVQQSKGCYKNVTSTQLHRLLVVHPLAQLVPHLAPAAPAPAADCIGLAQPLRHSPVMTEPRSAAPPLAR